ncbi:MAG: mechanosensitive ion channel family protein, partial [Bradymonadaceae bacterium]
EEVGLRATRIRQYGREQVVVPNSEMASTAVTNTSARDRRRISAELGLVYETTHAQMHQVIDNLRSLLDEHDDVWDGDWRVFFVEFGDNAWRQLRQELFLETMRIVEEAGTDFAFPTRSIHIEGDEEKSAPVEESTPVAEPAPGE